MRLHGTYLYNSLVKGVLYGPLYTWTTEDVSLLPSLAKKPDSLAQVVSLRLLACSSLVPQMSAVRLLSVSLSLWLHNAPDQLCQSLPDAGDNHLVHWSMRFQYHELSLENSTLYSLVPCWLAVLDVGGGGERTCCWFSAFSALNCSYNGCQDA